MTMRRSARSAGEISLSAFPVILVAGLLLSQLGCGYQVRSSVRDLPAGITSLGVPTFVNSSPQFKLEQRVTAAVLRELETRTRVPVHSVSSGVDAILLGDIRGVSSTPVTFGNDAFGSAFLVTVQISVKLLKAKDRAVIWQNDSFLFRERYVLNSKLTDFFSEENPALDRLARDFAGSLVSTLLNR